MKFTIRDLLLVTVIVALAVGWRVERASLRSEVQGLRAELARIEMKAAHDELAAPLPTVVLSLAEWELRRGLPNPSAPAPNPPKK